MEHVKHAGCDSTQLDSPEAHNTPDALQGKAEDFFPLMFILMQMGRALLQSGDTWISEPAIHSTISLTIFQMQDQDQTLETQSSCFEFVWLGEYDRRDIDVHQTTSLAMDVALL